MSAMAVFQAYLVFVLLHFDVLGIDTDSLPIVDIELEPPNDAYPEISHEISELENARQSDETVW